MPDFCQNMYVRGMGVAVKSIHAVEKIDSNTFCYSISYVIMRGLIYENQYCKDIKVFLVNII